MYMVTEITSGTAEIRTQALGHPSQGLVPCAQIGERRRAVEILASKDNFPECPNPGPGLTWRLDLFWAKL